MPYRVIKTTPWKVRELAHLKKEGKLHLPDLQRGFVWSPERILSLFDSLYNKYPVGALLLWKPTWEPGEPPFLTQPWDLYPPDSMTGRGAKEVAQELKEGSLFVLDGQQRLTSLLKVIFQSTVNGRTTLDPDLLVALSPNEQWMETPFWLKSRQLVKKMRDGLLVPAHVLFEALRGGNENLAIQKAIGEWVETSDALFFDALNRANTIRNAILEEEIIAYEIDAEAEDENVIEIFARLNQQGVRLRPADLAAARLTGTMERFRGRAKEALRSPQLSGYVAKAGDEERTRSAACVDTDLLVRTALFLSTGIVRYSEIERRKTGGQEAYTKVDSPWTGRHSSNEKITFWDKACESIEKSVKMYKDAGVPVGNWLPYRFLLVPPAVSYALTGELESGKWLAWAVACSLWGYYSSQADTHLQRDLKVISEKNNILELIDSVKTHAKRLDSVVPEENDFTEGIVRQSGLLLALLIHLMSATGRSFPSQKLLSAREEPIEVQHIFPRAVINSYVERDNRFDPDRLGNLTLIFRSDNETLGDTSPVDYLPAVQTDVLTAHGIPEERDLWVLERYPDFCEARERQLSKIVCNLFVSWDIQ